MRLLQVRVSVSGHINIVQPLLFPKWTHLKSFWPIIAVACRITRSQTFTLYWPRPKRCKITPNLFTPVLISYLLTRGKWELKSIKRHCQTWEDLLSERHGLMCWGKTWRPVCFNSVSDVGSVLSAVTSLRTSEFIPSLKVNEEKPLSQREPVPERLAMLKSWCLH